MLVWVLPMMYSLLAELFHFYPRDAMLARVIAIAPCLSVRLSVRPSVTRQYCVKTKKASVMIFSPSGSPKTLVFGRQISSPNSKGFPLNGGLKPGSVGKIQRLSSFKRQYLENVSRYGQSYHHWLIGSRTVHGLSIDTKIDDLGWPWTAVRSNFVGISRDLLTLGNNHG